MAHSTIESVVKIGGSLIRSRTCLRRLAQAIAQIGARHRLAVLAGGGELADEVRALSARFGLSDASAHLMAIRAMDIHAHLLAELIEGGVVAGRASQVRELVAAGRIPVLLAADLLVGDREVPESWDVTSDSLALRLAQLLGARGAVLLKRIDGIPGGPGGAVVPRITPTGLRRLRPPASKAVDPYFATLAARCPLPTWVLNGEHPERLCDVLEERSTVGTLILARRKRAQRGPLR